MGPAKGAIFFETQFIRRLFLILCGRIIPVFAMLTGQCRNITHSVKGLLLFNNFADDAGPDGPATLANGKPQLLLHGDGSD